MDFFLLNISFKLNKSNLKILGASGGFVDHPALLRDRELPDKQMER